MKKQETFRVKIPSIRNENSFGAWGEENDVLLEVTIGIRDDDGGYFEFYDVKTGGEKWYAEGGLWFEGNVLNDYDGVFSLPDFIISKLVEWGFDMDEYIETEQEA